jgi:glutaredoxin
MDSFWKWALLVLTALVIWKYFFNEKPAIQLRAANPAPSYMSDRANGGFLLYTTTSCPYCTQARQWLTKNKIPFQECNTTIDKSCADDLARIGYSGVPRWVYRGETATGFGEDAWRSRFLEKK